MRNFLLSSLILLLLLTGCASLKPKGLKPCFGTAPTRECLQSPFHAHFDKMLFKATLDIRKEHLTGLMLFKTMPDSSIRVVFTNEIGMTFFDFIMKDGTFKTGYCFEPMNRKPVISIFRTCYELMLTYDVQKGDYLVFCEMSTGNPVSQAQFRKYRTWAGQLGDEPRSAFINGMSNFSDQTNISFTDYHGEVPYSVTIVNPFIDLKIRLQMISF